MNKTLCCIYVALMICICLFFSIGAFFFPPDAEAEGRELTPVPALLGADGWLNPTYADELETVFAERFALRTQLVTLNSRLREAVFGVGSDEVIVGREGYLFFGETLDDYLGRNPMTDGEIDEAADALAKLAAYADENGAKFLFAAAPNKNTVYGAYMPANYLPATGDSDLDRLHAALDARGVPYLDLRPLFTEDGLYHKRDTHWNGEGARLAYDAILDALDMAHDDFAAAPRTTVQDFPGDLDALLTPSLARTDDNVVYTLPEYRYTSNYATPMDLIVTTVSDGAPTRAVLLFRDSFGSALIPYFSASFSSARYERANPFRIDRIVREPVDAVIVEIAERNLRDLIGAADRAAG